MRTLGKTILAGAAAIGIAGACGMAWAGGPAFHTMTVQLPDGTLPPHVQPALDARAGAFAFAISLLAGASVALLPAFAAIRRNLSDAIKEGARSVSTGLASLRRPSTRTGGRRLAISDSTAS